jgi:hypothetical protein
MKINYLTWIHNLSKELHGRADCYNLLYSNVQEPTDLLVKHYENSNEFSQQFKQPNAWGHPHLVEGIANNYGISSDRILITTGASLGMVMVCQTFLKKGDHVIVEHPVYEPLLAATDSLGARISLLKRRAEQDYQIDLNELDSLVTPQTKLIILSNLHNPSSVWLEDKLLQEIVTTAKKYNEEIKVVIDEVYHDFVKTQQRPAALLDDSFISINSLSKVYGLGLLRCGWILAAPTTIDKIRRQGILAGNFGSRLTETLASLVFDNLAEYDSHWSAITAQNRTIVQEVLSPLLEQELLVGKIPTTGCIFFPQIAGLSDTRSFTQALANQQQVFVVPGYFFGAPAYIRISFGGKAEELQIGLEKLATAIVQI